MHPKLNTWFFFAPVDLQIKLNRCQRADIADIKATLHQQMLFLKIIMKSGAFVPTSTNTGTSGIQLLHNEFLQSSWSAWSWVHWQYNVKYSSIVKQTSIWAKTSQLQNKITKTKILHCSWNAQGCCYKIHVSLWEGREFTTRMILKRSFKPLPRWEDTEVNIIFF